MSGPPRRSGNSPAGGLVPTITSSLRGVIMYNQTALTQAISQIEAIGDIQNELVNARSAHAQVSKDLQICMERHAAQSRLLLKTQDELRVTTQNLHGAREQLGLLESRLASVDGKEQVGQGVQQNKASNYFVYSDMATSAAIAAQHSDNPIAKVDVLPQSSSRVRALERRLAVVLGMSDQDLTMASDRLVETPTGPNARATPGEVLACFKALRSEFDAVVNAAQSYTSRNAMLEATLTTIKSLHISAAPTVAQPAPVDVRTTVDRKSPLRGSPVDGDIEMDVERTEAARAARQNSSATPSAQPQPTVRPTSIQPPDASRLVGAASSTPTQPTFFAQQTDSPQRKRQRTLTSGGTPEPLPRDNILHVYIRLVSATYKVQLAGSATDGNNIPAGQKQVICKLCETRHKDQPDFPVATFPYDQDALPVVPPLADAESTQTRVQPWIDHIQQKHQKMYNTVMERARPRSSTTASAASTS
ncbi:unnamed protein product [Rhizoctonia solani]|uniref:Uncharacterized protein n=1 Tax=Rhizoctonia solani TaxID=456999 RepID=A0A8H3DRD5_9AGAM|nr:unnamed protein product [Rhizoctonia solani]CAE6532823.1 unnamed protein product [Rhizoctonia solani]